MSKWWSPRGLLELYDEAIGLLGCHWTYQEKETQFQMAHLGCSHYWWGPKWNPLLKLFCWAIPKHLFLWWSLGLPRALSGSCYLNGLEDVSPLMRPGNRIISFSQLICSWKFNNLHRKLHQFWNESILMGITIRSTKPMHLCVQDPHVKMSGATSSCFNPFAKVPHMLTMSHEP